MFSIFVDNDGYKCRQTSRPVVGVEIQTNCNRKAHPCHFRYLLDCSRCRCFMQKLNLPHTILVRLCIYSVLLDDLIRILHNDFLSSSSSSHSRSYKIIQDHAQQHPSQPNALNIALYGKAVYNALCVQVALLVCYLPYCILVILRTFTKISATHLVVSEALTVVLVSFNSTLNPFIYCWKISEVRQAVKLTMRQTLCRW